MLKASDKRVDEGWCLSSGINYLRSAAKRSFDFADSIVAIANKENKKFPTNQDAVDYVQKRANEGSEYHQATINYVAQTKLLTIHGYHSTYSKAKIQSSSSEEAGCAEPSEDN